MRTDVPRELRGLDEAGRQEVWERGLKALREVWMKEHIKWTESLLDG
jgi:hypothetical protein